MGVNLGARVGAIRKRMGCKAGVPDIIILQPSGKYHGMTLELKVKGGHISEEQKAFKNKAKEFNYYSIIMPPLFELNEGLEWAKKEIQNYFESINYV